MEIVSEEWRPVKDYEGLYEVSDRGRVKSLDRLICHSNGKVTTFSGCERRLKLVHTGYLAVTLSKGCKPKTKYVHSLVAESFLGDKPKGLDVNHIDGDKKNNSLKNLEYVTRSENLAHSYRLGLSKRGEAASYAKWSDQQMRDGHRLVVGGMSYSAAAEAVGVNTASLQGVCIGRTRRHLGLPPLKFRNGRNCPNIP